MVSLANTDTLRNIAKLLDIDRNDLRKLLAESGAPEPVATVAGTRLFNIRQVAVFIGRVDRL